MKNIIMMALAILIVSGQIQANTISQQTAQTVAINFFKAQVPSANNLTSTLNYTHTEADGSVDFYVFDISPAIGFVIVSADDNSKPIIAYSTESHFNANAPLVGVSNWINSAAKKIRFAVVNNTLPDAHIRNLWSTYTGNHIVSARSAAVTIGPLLTTVWNQEPYYNSLCPFNVTDNQRCVTGCVATAMAQIMKYWNYPQRGTGSYSYSMSPYGNLSADFSTPFNWAAMPNAVSSNTSPVDTLMYKCGVSVNMSYGDDLHGGSGAFVLQSDVWGNSPCAQNAYVTYFYYNPNTIQGVYMSSYNSADWISLMESELNAGRVIQYEGNDANSGGHTWVCDGYDANNLLHMNWGWGGASNGYYSVDNLNAGGYTFSQNDAALIGIEPIYPVNLNLTASNTTICPGTNTTLTAHGPAGATYAWSPTTGLSCANCASPQASPATSTLYTVTVDSNGVTSARSVAVLVKPLVSASFTATAAPYCTLPENVGFVDNSMYATNYLWDFGDGVTSTAANPVHSYSTRGTYSIKLTTSNSCGVDSLVRNQAVTIQGGPPVSSCQNICPGESVNLYASGAGTLSWYAPSQVDLMATGNTYAAPPLSSTITYYVGSTITPPIVAAGPLSNMIGAGSYTNNYPSGLTFNSSAAQYLMAVDVYASGAGARTFVIEDQQRHVLDSMTVTLISGKQTVPLTLSIPVGNNLQLTVLGTPNLYYNSAGAVYPYNSGDGSLQIIGNTSGDASYYYCYNWQVEKQSCSTPLTPVTVYVLGTGGGSIVASGTGSPTVNFAPSDTNATTYAWSFGDGATSTQEYPTHTYAAGGVYTIQLIVSNDTCSDTTSKSISTRQLGISDLSSFSAFSVFPNPVKDHINMNLTSAKQISDCQIKINNILGQNELTTDINIMNGQNQFSFDISSLASGVYFISLQNGRDIVTEKFVKASE